MTERNTKGPVDLLPDIGKSMCDPRDCTTKCTACDPHDPLPEHARKVLDAAQERIAELIKERDWARQELCFAKATAGPEAAVEEMMQYARDCAKAYGWQYLYEQEKK
jgi:hypothetical protein